MLLEVQYRNKLNYEDIFRNKRRFENTCIKISYRPKIISISSGISVKEPKRWLYNL